MADKKVTNIKLLVVEDDDVNRKIMDYQLRNYYNVDFAKEGNEAIDLFLHNYYHLILLDINLGAGMNGVEVMKKIRKSDKGKSVPVIAITAYANFGDRQIFQSEGFDDYILKPYHSDDLLKSIMGLLNEF